MAFRRWVYRGWHIVERTFLCVNTIFITVRTIIHILKGRVTYMLSTLHIFKANDTFSVDKKFLWRNHHLNLFSIYEESWDDEKWLFVSCLCNYWYTLFNETNLLTLPLNMPQIDILFCSYPHSLIISEQRKLEKFPKMPSKSRN